MKKLAMHAVRLHGTGSRGVDDVIKKEMHALVDVFSKQDGRNFDPRVTLMTAVVNGITAMVSTLICNVTLITPTSDPRHCSL